MFKIGQQVRWNNRKSPASERVVFADKNMKAGTIGVILTPHPLTPHGYYTVFFPEFPSDHETRAYTCHGTQLDPLDDEPGFKRFMERVLEPRPELQGLPLELPL